MNDRLFLSVLVYLALQMGLLLALPKWWKAAACPALLVLPVIFFDLTNGGNLSGFITIWLTPYAIGWLLLILAGFVISIPIRAQGQREQDSHGSDDHDDSPEAANLHDSQSI